MAQQKDRRSRAPTTVTTTVHVIVSGIVSLIPRGANGWRIRLQDARGHSHHPHVASLVAELPVTGPTPDDTIDQLHGRPMLGGWFPLTPGPITVGSTLAAGNPTIPQGAPYFALRILDGYPATDPQRGIANATFAGVDLDIRLGYLDTTALNPQRWKWKRNGAPRVDWNADEVCWKFTIEGTELRLTIPYKDANTSFVFAPPTANAPIELRLQNLLERDLFPRLPVLEDEDDHPTLYFEQGKPGPSAADGLESPPESPPPQPPIDDHGHRLAAQEIVKHLEDPGPGLRVNCPPGAWEGEA